MSTDQAITGDQLLLLDIKADETLRQDAKIKHLCQSLSNIALLDYAEGLWWSIAAAECRPHAHAVSLLEGVSNSGVWPASVKRAASI